MNDTERHLRVLSPNPISDLDKFGVVGEVRSPSFTYSGVPATTNDIICRILDELHAMDLRLRRLEEQADES